MWYFLVMTPEENPQAGRWWELGILVFVLVVGLVFGLSRWVEAQLGNQDRVPMSLSSSMPQRVVDFGCVDDDAKGTREFHFSGAISRVRITGRFCRLRRRVYVPQVQVSLGLSREIPIVVRFRNRSFITSAVSLSGERTIEARWVDEQGLHHRTVATISNALVD